MKIINPEKVIAHYKELAVYPDINPDALLAEIEEAHNVVGADDTGFTHEYRSIDMKSGTPVLVRFRCIEPSVEDEDGEFSDPVYEYIG